MSSSNSQSTKLSRTLTTILRHQAKNLGLTMSSDGFVSIKSLIALPMLSKLNPSQEKIEEIVKQCPKQRFALSEDKTKIKANQGHSIQEGLDDEKMLKEIKLDDDEKEFYLRYPTCIHGTYLKAWEAIQLSGGLSRMNRRHIHFSSKPPGAKTMISGMRANAEILLHLDLKAAITDGYKFYESQNEVILTAGDEKTGILPLQYIIKVEQQKKQVKST
jgi:RNA:NAD 2'-phosphotransferase (TPT1/KptA family)